LLTHQWYVGHVHSKCSWIRPTYWHMPSSSYTYISNISKQCFHITFIKQQSVELAVRMWTYIHNGAANRSWKGLCEMQLIRTFLLRFKRMDRLMRTALPSHTWAPTAALMVPTKRSSYVRYPCGSYVGVVRPLWMVWQTCFSPAAIYFARTSRVLISLCL
jgi:hypothetical protein